MDYDLSFFAERLAALRIKKGVSARDMSLSIGQSPNYINKIENKKNYPSMAVFFYICEFLEITPKDFFDGDIKNTELMRELSSTLREMDDETLRHILGLAQKLQPRKRR
jgi:transcriptional regulator with XRE-family HTH domain